MMKKTKMSGRDSEFARHLVAKYGPSYRIAESSNGLKDRKMIVRVVPMAEVGASLEVVARGHSWAAAEKRLEKVLAEEHQTETQKRHRKMLRWGLGIGIGIAVACAGAGAFWLA